MFSLGVVGACAVRIVLFMCCCEIFMVDGGREGARVPFPLFWGGAFVFVTFFLLVLLLSN